MEFAGWYFIAIFNSFLVYNFYAQVLLENGGILGASGHTMDFYTFAILNYLQVVLAHVL
jgi:hypothetical protein